MGGTISPRLLRAFRAARYCAAGAVAGIGRRCPALDPLLARQAAAFITAWNPGGRRHAEGRNRRADLALQARLRRLAPMVATGEGRGWREEHWLAAMDPRQAAVLGRLFRQAAIVTLRRGQPARLVVLAPWLLAPRPRAARASRPG